MNAAWATSLDHLWRSATLPMWLALAAAVFFALIVLVTLLRAEKSVANGALTVITLLAIGVAAAATLRGSDTAEKAVVSPAGTSFAASAVPALSCMDELAGEMVLAACEKSLFAAPDSVAAAVSGAAVQLDRLLASGDVAAANKAMTPDLARLRRSVERDRYGLFAYLLQSRDHCMPDACPAYASLTDRKQIAAHMEERLYEGLVTRYAPSWTAPVTASAGAAPQVPGAAAAAAAAVAGLPASVPTGKPTSADFPSSSSIPAVSIMTDTPAPAPKPPAAPRAARKQAAPKEAPHPQAAAPAAPVPLAPGAAQADN